MLAIEYTEECLQKLSKSQLIAMVLSQTDETKATTESLRGEVKDMNSNFRKNLRLILVLLKSYQSFNEEVS